MGVPQNGWIIKEHPTKIGRLWGTTILGTLYLKYEPTDDWFGGYTILSIYPINLSIYQPINLSTYQPINLSIYQSINLSILFYLI